MTPRECLTPKRDSNRYPGLGRTHQPRDRPDRRHQRTGHQESSSKHVRQARRVEPAGVGHVRRQHGGKDWPEADRVPTPYPQAAGAD